MPRSAGMHKSGVRMVREKAMDGFFNNLLDRIEVRFDNNIDTPVSRTARFSLVVRNRIGFAEAPSQ